MKKEKLILGVLFVLVLLVGIGLFLIPESREFIQDIVGVTQEPFLSPVYTGCGDPSLNTGGKVCSEVTACGDLSSDNTYYLVINDVTSNGLCFTNMGSNSILDLNGYTIINKNILNNGGFEYGLTCYTNWAHAEDPNNIYPSTYDFFLSNDSVEGNYSIEIRCMDDPECTSGGGRSKGWISMQTIPSLAGQSYKLTFDHKCTGGAQASLYYPFDGSVININPCDTTWRTYEITYTAPGTFANINFRNTHSGSLFVDNVTLTYINGSVPSIPINHTGQSNVTWDERGVFIDGERFLALGFFSVPFSDLDYVANTLNATMVMGFSSNQIENCFNSYKGSYLDSVYDLGMYAAPDLTFTSRMDKSYGGVSPTLIMDDIIRNFGNHKAINAWFLNDEPDVNPANVLRFHVEPEDLINQYNVVKTETTIPIYFDSWYAHRGYPFSISFVQPYAPATDIFMGEPYFAAPFSNLPPTLQVFNAINSSKPVWLAQNNWPPENQIVAKAYYVITNGATGILYFTYNSIVDTSKDDEVAQAFTELRFLKDAIFGVDVDAQFTNDDSQVDYIARELNGDHYIISVNPELVAKTVRYDSSLIADGQTIEVMFENRNIIAGPGFFTDNYPSTTRHVYLIKASGDIPEVNLVECHDGSSWRDCKNFLYGETIQQVRVNCTTQNFNMVSANFKLENVEDSRTFFDQAHTSSSGDYWILNNNDLTIGDSGGFKLTATCTNDGGYSRNKEENWNVAWGTLSAVHDNLAINNSVQSNGTSFSYQTTLTCTGGECGNVSAILDPTFGNTNFATSSYNAIISGTKFGARFIMGNEPGFLDNISTGIVGQTGNTIYAAVYDDNAGAPGNKIADATNSVIGGPAYSTEIFYFNQDNLLADQYYWLTLSSYGTGSSSRFWYSNILGGEAAIADGLINESSSFGTVTSNKIEMYNIYASYTIDPAFKGVVPMNSGSPFYTTSQNPTSCDNMISGSSCSTSWDVVANGEEKDYDFFVIYDALYLGVVDIESPKMNISIGVGGSPISSCAEGAISSQCTCGVVNDISVGLCCNIANDPVWFDPDYPGCPLNYFYVDQNDGSCSDANAGSETQPWCTMGKAANTLVAGDVVLVKTGSYSEPGTGQGYNPAMNPSNSGNVNNPITFKTYPGHEVNITNIGTGALIGVYLRDYIIWDGFRVFEGDSYAGAGPVVVWRTTGSQVKNLIIESTNIPNPGDNHNGIRAEFNNEILVKNNIIRDGGGNGHNQAGIMIYWTNNSVFENNEVYNYYTGIYPKGGFSPNNTFRYNLLHDNSEGFFMQYDGESLFNQNIIYDCLLGGGSRFGIGFTPVSPNKIDALGFYNNIVYNCSMGIVPVILNSHTGGGIVDGDYYNNIFSDTQEPFRVEVYNGYDPNAMFISDYNDFFNYNNFYMTPFSTPFMPDLATWSNLTSKDNNSLEVDPLFTNILNRDFHLQPGSLVRNQGLDIWDYDNDGDIAESINMGAYITGNEIIGIIDYWTLSSQPLIVGSPDVNSDGKVNVIDLSLAVFNQGNIGNDYSHLDVNGDSNINLLDFIEIMLNFG